MTAIVSIGVTTLSAQRAMLKNVTPNVPNFQIETITTASSEKDLTNLDVYLKISYDELQFIR